MVAGKLCVISPFLVVWLVCYGFVSSLLGSTWAVVFVWYVSAYPGISGQTSTYYNVSFLLFTLIMSPLWFGE